MIRKIETNRNLKNYIHREIEDAGVRVGVDTSLAREEFVGVKVDDYYMGQRLGGETPKAVDFVVAVDCGFDWYNLYILEMKSTNHYTTADIEVKFDTAIYRFMQEEYGDIFMNDRYKYRNIKLYLVSSSYRAALQYGSYEKYLAVRKKIDGRDTLRMDRYLSGRLYRFRSWILQIEKEVPPNPLISK